MGRSHPEVDFIVTGGRDEAPFKHFEEAAAYALTVAVSGRPVQLDVVVYGEGGAEWFSGMDGVMEYRDDPDASVFRRYVIKVDDQGRVP